MLLSFHWADAPGRKIRKPTEYASLDESIELPSIEEVDTLPIFTADEHVEIIKLEEIGSDALNKMYTVDMPSNASIKCKGISREEYRF
ncbi:hypothetical protein NEIG_01071 [Nematocida sp. ERTm5]|nr:hypothetical protein NEIRO02_1699 [Nematocida sp. AWRm79]KAI5184207.1 hypothetical protein NEIRO03_1661 [Nematocida sp. AWRm78]OAG30038.1 hypothetical protein NEIG_01071 [Nematocida sp. ERTm5]